MIYKIFPNSCTYTIYIETISWNQRIPKLFFQCSRSWTCNRRAIFPSYWINPHNCWKVSLDLMKNFVKSTYIIFLKAKIRKKSYKCTSATILAIFSPLCTIKLKCGIFSSTNLLPLCMHILHSHTYVTQLNFRFA